MEIIYLKSQKDIIRNIEELGLVLGYFDGVHIGHSQLINFAKANTKPGSLGVLTFDRPLKTIEGSLMSIEDKAEQMATLGVDYLFIIVCDDKLKHMSYQKFINDVLKAFNPKSLYCGPDFKFGYLAEGDVTQLKREFKSVYVLDYVKDHFGAKISSTSIKTSIKNGLIEEANRHLGRAYRMSGAVVHGFKEGTIIGYPTANLLPDTNYVIPPNGVYFTRIEIDGKKYNSITNIGVHPTVNKVNSPTIETYVLDYNDEIYGCHINLYFYKKERDEQQFLSLDDLKNQITLDVKKAEEFLDYKIRK